MRVDRVSIVLVPDENVGYVVAASDDAALSNPKLVWESIELPERRSAAVMIDGEPKEAATRLVRLLRDESKVI